MMSGHVTTRAKAIAAPFFRLLLVLLLTAEVEAWPWPMAPAAAVAHPRSASAVHATSFALDLLPPRAVHVAAPTDSPPAAISSANTREDDVVSTATTVVRPPSPDVFLVVGVKSRVLRGVDTRRAIRETWASPAITVPLGVRVLFLGCEPDLSILTDDAKTAAREAMEQEKDTYHDLYTHELQCVDSFFTLVDKTVAFMEIALTTFPTMAYAMVVDDDVYVRLDRLVALLQSDRIPNKRFYGGNAAGAKQRKPTAPMRNPESRYYLPTTLYPLAELPPYVAGAHYIVSHDVVAFIARNRRDLRGLKGLDDATIALWTLMLGIRPTFLPEFQIARMWNCTETLISYADMSPAALQIAHANLVHGRAFCAGYDRGTWFKPYSTITFKLDDDDPDENGDVRFHWDVELDPRSSRLRITTTVTIANETVQLLYVPATAPYATAFCNRVLPLLEAKLSILVGTNFCRQHRTILLTFLKGHDTTMPSLRALLTLARHNLERDAIDDAADNDKSVVHVRVIAVPTQHARAVHVLVECLMVAVYADKHVVVVTDSEPEGDGGTMHTTPSVVVVVRTSESESTTVEQLARRFPSQHTKLLLLSADGSRIAASSTDDPRIVAISADRSTPHARHLYVPQAAVVLAGAIRYSPMALLHRAADAQETNERAFAAVYTRRCGDAHHEQELLSVVDPGEAVNQVGASGACPDASSPVPVAPSQTPTDDAIDQLKRYKFVLAFEQNGSMNEGLALAFLAGSVPVFHGDSETAERLFNPKAFIDCGRFASRTDCGAFVAQVHSSPSLYEQFIREPPVVNVTAFVEAFSWHPQVAAVATAEHRGVLVGHRLRQLLDDP